MLTWLWIGLGCCSWGGVLVYSGGQEMAGEHEAHSLKTLKEAQPMAWPASCKENRAVTPSLILS